VIERTEAVRALERAYTRGRLSKLTYADALAVYAALWRQACALNPDFPGDWKADVGPDLAMARAVNGLPPSA
jgi:hypothetical protein